MTRRLLWLLGFRRKTIEHTLAFHRSVYGPRVTVIEGDYGLAEYY
jgi:hypothetical protein